MTSSRCLATIAPDPSRQAPKAEPTKYALDYRARMKGSSDPRTCPGRDSLPAGQNNCCRIRASRHRRFREGAHAHFPELQSRQRSNIATIKPIVREVGKMPGWPNLGVLVVALTLVGCAPAAAPPRRCRAGVRHADAKPKHRGNRVPANGRRHTAGNRHHASPAPRRPQHHR